MDSDDRMCHPKNDSDIIAMLAYLQYAIVDVAPNNELNGQLARRIEQLRTYLEGRAGGIVERVVDVRWM